MFTPTWFRYRFDLLVLQLARGHITIHLRLAYSNHQLAALTSAVKKVAALRFSNVSSERQRVGRLLTGSFWNSAAESSQSANGKILDGCERPKLGWET